MRDFAGSSARRDEISDPRRSSSENSTTPSPAILHVERAVPHKLEILTDAQWAQLGPEDLPETFSVYGPNCNFRVMTATRFVDYDPDDEPEELSAPGDGILDYEPLSPPPRSRDWGRFLVLDRFRDGERHYTARRGLAVEDVIERERELYAESFAAWPEKNKSLTPEDIASMHGDVYVCRLGGPTLALLRCRADGTLSVVRFDDGPSANPLADHEIPPVRPVLRAEYRTRAEIDAKHEAPHLTD